MEFLTRFVLVMIGILLIGALFEYKDVDGISETLWIIAALDITWLLSI